MKWQEMVMRYLTEKSKAKVEAGHKAMAKSTGLSVGEEKRETSKLKKKGVIHDIEKRSKEGRITNPEAYKFGTERKILKQHAKKIGK